MAKTFRAAVIGRTNRGNYGHNLDVVWQSTPNVELVAVADDDRMGLANSATKLGLEKAYSDYRKMLDEVKPDVVTVAQRWTDQHKEMILECAARGVHVFCEKPLCRTPAEADEIVAACERSHIKLAMAHQTHYSPKIPVIQELISSGKLGKLVELRGRGKEDARGGGEDLWVLGSHILDLMVLFSGQPQWASAVVRKEGQPITGADVVEGPEGLGLIAGDTVQAMFGFEKGETGFFGSVKNNPGKPSHFGLTLLGTGGMLHMETNYLPRVFYTADTSWVNPKWQAVSSAGVGQPEPLTVMNQEAAGNVAIAEDLLKAIEEDRQPKCGMYQARTVVEMITAVYESQCTGAVTPLPLKTRDNPLARLKK